MQFLGIVLALYSLTLYLQLTYSTLYLVQLFGHRVYLQPQLGSSLVDKVDGLVGQETVGYIAVRQLCRCYNGLVLDMHFMVHLVAFLQPAKYGYGVGHIGLVDQHTLKPTLQSLVLFEILLIFAQRSSPNSSQLATSQCRLQNIGGIHGTLAATGTHKGMYLVDKKNYLAIGFVYLAYHTLQSLFKLAFVFGTGYQSTHVQRVNGLGF